MVYMFTINLFASVLIFDYDVFKYIFVYTEKNDSTTFILHNIFEFDGFFFLVI